MLHTVPYDVLFFLKWVTELALFLQKKLNRKISIKNVVLVIWRLFQFHKVPHISTFDDKWDIKMPTRTCVEMLKPQMWDLVNMNLQNDWQWHSRRPYFGAMPQCFQLWIFVTVAKEFFRYSYITWNQFCPKKPYFDNTIGIESQSSVP